MIDMNWLDRVIELPITVVLIVGGYQFYFWAQRQNWYEARHLETRFDGMISYSPHWVWIYSGLYYPMIVLAAYSVDNWRDYALSATCYLVLLVAQMYFFLFHPVEIPKHWREVRVRWDGHPSQRFMDLVWSYDKFRNSMPSMHVSVAVMTDLTIWRRWHTLGHVCVLFPVLIAVSALKTKQHYVVDILPGVALGVLVFFAWNYLTDRWS